ncbi:hypothetical protein A79E_4238 [Klebsiella pneumoniae subsp. pneumoniae 1084]|nr:hypothetical protein A79E_4238 [Klebsiella pneumoniae subsp. pneumoniae 1084]
MRFGHTRGSPRRYQWHQLSIFIILSLSALSRLRRRWEFGEKPAQQAKKSASSVHSTVICRVTKVSINTAEKSTSNICTASHFAR